MKNIKFGKKSKIITAVLCALLIGVFVAAILPDNTSPLTNVMSVVMSPLQKCAAVLSEKLTDFRMNFTSAEKYREEIESLKNEVAEYKSMLTDHEKNKKKLDAYEKFLGIKEAHPDYTFVPADINARTTDDIYNSFVINKGSADGIKVNNPVISGNILVGIVKQVTQSSATVYTLFNPNVNVSAYEINARVDCIVESDNLLSMRGYLKLTGLTESTSVTSGGIISTSGVGGIYPADLLIGTVSEVVADDTTISAYALITPAADYDSIRDVFVLTGFDK